MIKSYKSNLLDIYNKFIGEYNDDDILWYSKMSLFIYNNGVDFQKDCGIFALMSVNTSLKFNISKFEYYQKTGLFKGLLPNKFEAIQKSKTRDEILIALNGLKIQNFFMNLYQPLDPNYVTIDRHAARACGENKKVSPKIYKEIAHSYKEVAEELRMLPNQLQAMVWCKYVA